MSQKSKPNNSVDLATVLTRLKARNDQIDRTVDASLKRLGVGRKALDLGADLLAKHISPERLKQGEHRLERDLTDVSSSDWERVTRPSLETLTCSLGSRLIRA